MTVPSANRQGGATGRPERAIVRHWHVVMLAYTFSLQGGAAPEADSGSAASAPASSAPAEAVDEEKSGPNAYRQRA